MTVKLLVRDNFFFNEIMKNFVITTEVISDNVVPSL